MRSIVQLAGIASLWLLVGPAHAALSFNTARTPLSGASRGLDRVTLYALPDNGGDVWGGTITVKADRQHALKFRLIPAFTDPDTGEVFTPESVVYTTLDPTTVTRTAVNSILFTSPAPGYPEPDPVSAIEVYRVGLTTFSMSGFDGRDPRLTDVGLKAGPSVNGGRGAAIMSAVVPTNVSVRFSGFIGDDLPFTPNYSLDLTSLPLGPVNTPEPGALGLLPLALVACVRTRART